MIGLPCTQLSSLSVQMYFVVVLYMVAMNFAHLVLISHEVTLPDPTAMYDVDEILARMSLRFSDMFKPCTMHHAACLYSA